jgi:hypothetical protein
MENLFADFDFALLDTREFKEDSVREELVVPILKNLGYRPSGTTKSSGARNYQRIKRFSMTWKSSQ